MNKTIFKQTPVGLIPSDWEVKKLGDIGVFSKGKGILKAQISQSGLPCIRYGEIYTTHHFVIKEFKSYISEEVASESQQISTGDILFAGSGETIDDIGKAVVYLGNERAYAGGDTIIFKPTDDNSETISYILEMDSSRKQKRTFGQGNSVVHIYPSDLKKLKIPVPSILEQQKIASILSTWDVAIDNCKGIIEELKVRNKGLAQQLLTGKIRVKGFEKVKWVLLPIKKISKDISKKNPNNKDLIVLSCTKYNGLVPSLEYFGRKIYSDDLTTYKIVLKGQFAYATNHIEEGSIGYQSNYEEALISPMYTVFQTDENINDNFLFRVLKSTHYIHEYQKRTEGSIDRRGGLRWDEFSKIKVPVPELKEQFAIVKVLDKATEELNQYQQKLQTLQLQKKGLMQQLLTGKIRTM